VERENRAKQKVEAGRLSLRSRCMPWSRIAVGGGVHFSRVTPYELPGLKAVFDTRFIYPDPLSLPGPYGKKPNRVSQRYQKVSGYCFVFHFPCPKNSQASSSHKAFDTQVASHDQLRPFRPTYAFDFHYLSQTIVQVWRWKDLSTRKGDDFSTR
jgi:hypothetical protein